MLLLGSLQIGVFSFQQFEQPWTVIHVGQVDAMLLLQLYDYRWGDMGVVPHIVLDTLCGVLWIVTQCLGIVQIGLDVLGMRDGQRVIRTVIERD